MRSGGSRSGARADRRGSVRVHAVAGRGGANGRGLRPDRRLAGGAQRTRIEDRTSGVEDGDWGLREFERFTVVIEPPGTRVPWSLGWSPNHRKDVRGRIELPVEASGDDLRLGTIAYWNLWGQRTVLGELHRLAKRLAKYYPWEEWQAAWFLLTGQPTWISPLTTRTEVRHGDGWDRGTVTMTMDLWVPAATVERIYRHVQHQRRQGAARRRDKALAVWLFTEDMERTAGRRLTTPELMRAWNEAHPDDRRADRSSFHDLRKRGEEAAARLLRPGDQMVIAPRATSATEATPVSTPKPADVSEQRRMGHDKKSANGRGLRTSADGHGRHKPGLLIQRFRVRLPAGPPPKSTISRKQRGALALPLGRAMAGAGQPVRGLRVPGLPPPSTKATTDGVLIDIRCGQRDCRGTVPRSAPVPGS